MENKNKNEPVRLNIRPTKKQSKTAANKRLNWLRCRTINFWRSE